MDENVLREYFSEDIPAEHFGMRIVEATPQRTVIEMPVDRRHQNGLAIAHGAALFALGDFCLAVVSNAAGQVSVAVQCSISFFRPAPVGAMLTATATERHGGGRLAHYDIEIRDEKQTLVAAMQGAVYRRKETLAEIVAGRNKKDETTP